MLCLLEQKMWRLSMEQTGATAKCKSTTVVPGKGFATTSGPAVWRTWCAGKLTVAWRPLREGTWLLEKARSRVESKPFAVGTRPLLDSAPLRRSQKAAWKPALFAQVSCSLVGFQNPVRPQNLLGKCVNKNTPFKMSIYKNKVFFFLSSLQTANPSGCRTGRVVAPAEWKSSTRGTGELFAMTNGACKRLRLHADSWTAARLYRLNTRRTMAAVKVVFGWMTWSALEKREPSVTVQREATETMTVTTMRTLAWFAQVINSTRLTLCYISQPFTLTVLVAIRFGQTGQRDGPLLRPCGGSPWRSVGEDLQKSLWPRRSRSGL